MAKSYPCIGSVTKIPKAQTKGRGVCKCGNPATYKIDVEVTYMRGDDIVVKSCDEHKRNVNFLLGIE